MGIVPDPNVQEHVIDEGLSIFFGPPCGILLQSNDLRGVRIPHLPPDTIMLGMELISLQKQKHGKHICPDLYRKAGFEMGVSRRGLPCVPGFVLTDYKSQSRTMASVLLGLYGRRGGDEVDKCEIISLYVEMSRCQTLETCSDTTSQRIPDKGREGISTPRYFSLKYLDARRHCIG